MGIIMRRFSTLFSVFLAVFSLNCAAQAAPPKLEKEKVVIAVGGKNLFYYLPLTIAEQRRTFRKTGVASSALARSGHRAKVHHSIINCKI
jgi:ABC-type nitrate/sulfonate/bicarbonate transport system substrate-binding protein